MIIVAGKIYTEQPQRDTFVTRSLDSVALARKAPGCLDFVVSADPLEPDSVNVYESWETEAQLEAFRGSGPDDGLSSLVLRAEVARHQIASSGPA